MQHLHSIITDMSEKGNAACEKMCHAHAMTTILTIPQAFHSLPFRNDAMSPTNALTD